MPRPPVRNPSDTKTNRLSSSAALILLFSPRQHGRNPLKLVSLPPCGGRATFWFFFKGWRCGVPVCVCSIALFMLLQQLASSLMQKSNKMSLHHVISSHLVHTEHLMIVIMALKSHLTSAELFLASFFQLHNYACVDILLKPLIIPRQTFLGRDFQSLVQTLLSLLFNTSTCPLIEKSFTIRIPLSFSSKLSVNLWGTAGKLFVSVK